MLDDETQIDETQPPFGRIIGAVLLSVTIIMGVLFFIPRGEGAQEIFLKPETPREAYLRILGQTHTGLRLVRLEDFITNTPQNDDHARAKAAHDILANHEQMAWVKLTHALYDLNNTEEQKSQALADYKNIWGVWRRQQDIPKLLQAAFPEMIALKAAQYAPNARRSQFRKGDKATQLAGAGIDQMTIARVPSVSANTVKTNPPIVQAVRIKYAKRPRYPRRARRKGVEATITLTLDIDERGHVARTWVVSVNTTRYKDSFIRAAKRAAMASRFHPKTVDGRPVASSGYVRKYTFSKQ